MALTFGQEKALAAVKSGKNVFITGGGGVGKSYLIKKIVESLEEEGKTVLVTASTGKAATLIDGVTCHRALQIPIKMTWAAKPKVNSKSPIYLADVLLIDEISMIRIDVFDFIVKTIEQVNEIRRSDPKNENRNPVQIITVGDFSQLSPVLKRTDDGSPDEGELLSDHYGFDVGAGYAFLSPGWKRCDFVFCMLTEVLRQSDRAMIDAVNAIRIGDRTALSYFKENTRKEDFPIGEEGVITLCGKNRTADRINNAALARLPGRGKDYRAEISGSVSEQDKQAPDLITLKEGARVIMLQNTEKYRNGSGGTVTRLRERCVSVVIDETGEEVEVPYATWTVEKYVVKKENGKKHVTKAPIGFFSQLPLRLGYAITIHKAQGQTFDKVVLILGSDDKKENAKSTRPEIFSYGQFYVAVSRVRDIKNLRIKGNIDLIELLADPEVVEFYKNNSCVISSPIISEVSNSETNPLEKDKKKKQKSPSEKSEAEESLATVQCPQGIAPLVLIFSSTLSEKSKLVAGTDLLVPKSIEKQVRDYLEMLS